MAIVLTLMVIVIIVAALVWMTRGKQSPTRRRTTDLHKYDDSGGASLGGIDKLKGNPLFWGLEIGQPGCEQAIKILGEQYPFDAVPQLPLAGCDSAMCTCQFKGLKNRRTQHRRDTEERRVEVRFEQGKTADRRSRKNRRRSDNWNDHTL